jgi:hypothetical protein
MENVERDPHHQLNNPVGDPDPTEWPDPYETRPDPRAPDLADGDEAPHTVPGATSTSEPHPAQDPDAEHWQDPRRRRNVDD